VKKGATRSRTGPGTPRLPRPVRRRCATLGDAAVGAQGEGCHRSAGCRLPTNPLVADAPPARTRRAILRAELCHRPHNSKSKWAIACCRLARTCALVAPSYDQARRSSFRSCRSCCGSWEGRGLNLAQFDEQCNLSRLGPLRHVIRPVDQCLAIATTDSPACAAPSAHAPGSGRPSRRPGTRRPATVPSQGSARDANQAGSEQP
jgi:hypothetical protein